MKYQPTITLTPELVDQLSTGKLVLQCGQWIKTWADSKPSRWVGARRASGVLWASHYSGGSGWQFEQFAYMASVRRAAPEGFFTTRGVKT